MALGKAYGLDGSGLRNFSLSEQDTGVKWVDGNTIFQKSIDLGTLPNATVKDVAHGITDMDVLISFDGCASIVGTTNVPLPFVQTGGVDGIQINIDDTNVAIQPGTLDRSSLIGFCTIYYTKT